MHSPPAQGNLYDKHVKLWNLPQYCTRLQYTCDMWTNHTAWWTLTSL